MVDESKYKRCPRCNGLGRVENPAYRGKLMRDKRVAKLLALRQVARRMEISAAYLSDLEHGRRHWSPRLIMNYTKAIGR